MSRLPPSTREPGRRGKQGETRARLIQVTIDLVRSEGLSALTTSRITRAAGIAQPGFYAHFRNVEDCLQTAMSQVVDEVRVKVAKMRKDAFRRFEEANGVTMTAIRASYEESLELVLAERTFAEIFLRYRRDPSLLGGYMGEVLDRIRADLSADIWSMARQAGFRDEHRGLTAFWTDQILALFFAGAEAMLDGRYDDRDTLLDSLAHSTFGIQMEYARWVGLLGPDAR
ncbi:MAG: TetR/AcrR family transcriptional regulator [Myxococcales bacterium]|jgi:AcrR family transcriptional regulator